MHTTRHSISRQSAFRAVMILIWGWMMPHCAYAGALAAQAELDHKPLPEQWYTGSIYAPSPALPQQGMVSIEPYLQGDMPIGHYNSHGSLKTGKGTDAQHTLEQYTVFKYALTDHLTIYTLPDYTYTSGDHKRSSSVQFNDLPVEFEYRLTKTYTPSVSLYLGFNAPTGHYSNLSRSNQGVGAGSWVIRYGIHSQFVRPFFHHAMRVRLWAQARQPVTGAKLRNITDYGTNQGFVGSGHPGAYGNEGASFELGITKKWVFALDLYHTWSASTSVRGYYRNAPEQHIHSRGGWSDTYNVGPALEYSWSPNMGGIIGVTVPVDGHNATRTLYPAGAVFALF